MSWYLYRLFPPRPDFARTMTDHERGVMGRHVAYWGEHVAAGRVMIFTPVADPAGDWGLAVVEADSLEQIRSFGDADPAVVAGMGQYDALLLPGAVTAG